MLTATKCGRSQGQEDLFQDFASSKPSDELDAFSGHFST